MKKSTYFSRLKVCLPFLALSSLHAATWNVTSSADTSTFSPLTLRYALLNAASGDAITFDPSVTLINLTNPLPTITQGSLSITGPVTIDGASSYSIFSTAPSTTNAGTFSLTNVILQNGKSLGGSGGNGGTNSGGGGGAGGGGAIYIHSGAQVSLTTTQLVDNKAQGGAGGNNSLGVGGQGGAGGGGGFGGGNGGAGSSSNTGGGGGGNAKGGNGSGSGAGSAGGVLNLVQSGGGGGGRGINGTGGAGGLSYQPQTAANSSAGGTAGAGGGGGAGANPSTGTGGAGTSLLGGTGGNGIGVDNFFAGGGGGGAPLGIINNYLPGAGMGTGGGGGGSYNTNSPAPVGGAGGIAGGGGGGGGTAANSFGGKGGFGAGGGSGNSGGSSLFGGASGSGGSGAGFGGGGGAGMGGALFIQSGATLTIFDGLSLSGNQATGGTGPSGNNGGSYGDDIFLRSGGTLVFKNNSLVNITSNIQSNQGLIDGSVVPNLGGGLVVSGSGTLVLSGANNTFTETTTIQSGVLSVSQNENLGDTTLGGGIGNTIVIGNGTLQTTASFTSPRLFSLTGQAIIDVGTTSANTLTLTNVISGNGSLTKQGPGTLYLNPSSSGNNYIGGTTLSAGVIQISPVGSSGTDAALGKLTSKMTMANGTTLNILGATNLGSQRPFTLLGAATFQIDNTATTFLNGPIDGSGSFIKTGSGDLFLGGVNSYTGGTDLQAGSTAGTTSGLQGNITLEDGATLTFLQAPSPGTFNGTLSTNLPLNSGLLEIGNGTPTPFQQVTIESANPGFLGTVHIFQSGVLNVNGSLADSSLITIDPGGFLSGTGVVGPLDNSGTVRPGNSIGTLTVNGDLTLNAPNSVLMIEISPTEASLLQVLGAANLAGNLAIVPDISGFFGLGNNYTILTNTGAQSGSFSLPVIIPPNFLATVIYFPHAVVLSMKVDQPFFNFPYENPNEKSVGDNLDALSSAGYLTPNSPLSEAINSLVGYPDSAINNALDQMHPASFSAFAEIQAALGGQLLSLFHRRPVPHCACGEGGRFWLEPYGNWLKEKNLGYELGFHAYSKGAAMGLDGEITDGWLVGFGAAWNDTHMHWVKGRGFSTITGYYGSVYTDYTSDNFYLGLSCIGGWDRCYSSRHIRFSTIDEKANATRHNLELMGQLSSAVFFGPDFCFAFPYLNLDYFYLQEKEVHESGAPGLNLVVNAHTGSTFRSEAGFAVQVQDINKASTFCVSPLFGLGWAMEMPINRASYRSHFEGQPISFATKGWDYTWQLFTLRFGFSLTYKCFSLSANYLAEMSPLEHTPLFEERGDIRLDLSW